MERLSDKQLEYGFNYYHKEDAHPRMLVDLSSYDGEDKLSINCTQLGDSFTPQYNTAKEKKRVLNEWCNFLTENPETFTELSFGTRMPQELFDALCCQTKLKKLDIKWGVYKDISKIENLKELELLHIGSGAGVMSISPLANLYKLKALSVENFQKITDYSPLASLEGLESLTIEGDVFGPQYIKLDSISFLKNMPQLRFLTLRTIRLQDKDYTPILELRNLEHLTLISDKETKKIYEQFMELPKLKWGLLKTNPKLYTSI